MNLYTVLLFSLALGFGYHFLGFRLIRPTLTHERTSMPYALHIRSWDGYLQKEVQNYFADDILTDLLTFVMYPGPLWDWIHGWPLLGIPLSETDDKEAVDRASLHLMGLKPIYDPYRHMLSQFLTDHERSGRYQMKSEHYTQVALRMSCSKQRNRIFFLNTFSCLTDIFLF